MLATDRQISCLETLQGRVEDLYRKGIVSRFNRMDWTNERELGMTISDASLRIMAYNEIIFWANVRRDLLKTY